MNYFDWRLFCPFYVIDFQLQLSFSYVIRNSRQISRGIKLIPSVKLYIALDGSMRRDATHHKVLYYQMVSVKLIRKSNCTIALNTETLDYALNLNLTYARICNFCRRQVHLQNRAP